MKLRRNQCKKDPAHPVSDWDGKYDAFACLVCDTWTSPPCSCKDTECEFKASARPERPSEAGYVMEPVPV